MLIWCGILFTLGILAFMDSLFNYGDIFRQVNSVLFMLVSLGLLIRTTTKIRTRSIEKYLERINTLEEQVFALQRSNDKDREPNRRTSVPA
jgi:hypothetical protein